MKTTTLKKGTLVWITDPASDYVGRCGTVLRRRNVRLDADTLQVRYEVQVSENNTDEFLRSALLPDAAAGSTDLEQLEQQAKDKALEVEASRQAERAKWREETLRRYVALRLEARAGYRATWQAREHYSGDPALQSLEVDPFTEDPERFRSGMYSSIRSVGLMADAPVPQVSWSSYGAVSPEEAIAFGKALVALGHRTMEQRAKLEAAQPDLLAALAEAGVV